MYQTLFLSIVCILNHLFQTALEIGTISLPILQNKDTEEQRFRDLGPQLASNRSRSEPRQWNCKAQVPPPVKPQLGLYLAVGPWNSVSTSLS